MYLQLLAMVLSMYVSSAEGFQVPDTALVEARGKGKYALLTHLAIVLAAKVGLHKILLSIALVVAVIKAMVVMAWILAIVRYVPSIWTDYKSAGSHSYHDNYHHHAPYITPNIFWDFLIHFFYVIATKLFVLKIIYGVIFYVIATKAWHFALWLIHYLKVKEKHQEVYVEYDHAPYHHDHHDHYDHHDNHDHYVIDGDTYDHQPYGAYSSSYGRIDTRYNQKKHVYDADGSYSVKG